MVVPKFTFGSVSEVVSERYEEQGAEREEVGVYLSYMTDPESQ